jgi:hypothetical protein
MIRYLLAGLIAAASLPAAAQVTSTSQTAVQSGASAGASNNGVSLNNTFEGTDHMRYNYGTQRIEQVAPLSLGGASAGFSNENCANTTQGGLSTMWFSAAKGNATESIRCNARRDAGVYVALAADADANNNHVIAAKLRSMAIFQKCTATEQELAACKQLGLVADGGTASVNIDSYRAKHAGDPMGISDAPQVDKARTPAARDSGWIEPTHNP